MIAGLARRMAFELSPAMIDGETDSSVQCLDGTLIHDRFGLGDLDGVLQFVSERRDLSVQRLPALDVDAQVTPLPSGAGEGQPSAEPRGKDTGLDVDDRGRSLDRLDERSEQRRPSRAIVDERIESGVESTHVTCGGIACWAGTGGSRTYDNRDHEPSRCNSRRSAH